MMEEELFWYIMCSKTTLLKEETLKRAGARPV
jgi:hypothetical protein